MEFCIEQYTNEEQHIYKQFHILRMKFYRQDFLWCNILFGHVCDILVWRLGHVCDIFDIDHVLTHARTEKFHNFCFGNTSQVPSNKLMT